MRYWWPVDSLTKPLANCDVEAGEALTAFGTSQLNAKPLERLKDDSRRRKFTETCARRNPLRL